MITVDDLRKAMCKNGKLENVLLFNYAPRTLEYYRLLAPYTDKNYPEYNNFDFLRDEAVWFLLANAHFKSREVGPQQLWACDIVYRGFGYTEDSGLYVGIECFTVHPKQMVEDRLAQYSTLKYSILNP